MILFYIYNAGNQIIIGNEDENFRMQTLIRLLNCRFRWTKSTICCRKCRFVGLNIVNSTH